MIAWTKKKNEIYGEYYFDNLNLRTQFEMKDQQAVYYEQYSFREYELLLLSIE